MQKLNAQRRETILTGKVFISCGRHHPEERDAALRVRDLLKNKFNLTPYVAITVQSLNDIMTITNGSNIIELRERGACDPARGFIYYVLSNPDWFTTTDELMEKVQRLVSDNGMPANYSG